MLLTGRTDGGRQRLRPRGVPVFVQCAGRSARDAYARIQHERTPARSCCSQCSEVAHQAQSVIGKRTNIIYVSATTSKETI